MIGIYFFIASLCFWAIAKIFYFFVRLFTTTHEERRNEKRMAEQRAVDLLMRHLH